MLNFVFKSKVEFGKYGKKWVDDLVKEGFREVSKSCWVNSSVFLIEGDMDITGFDRFIHTRRSKSWRKKLNITFDIADPQLVSIFLK